MNSGWHAIPADQRTNVLGCTAVVLVAFLYSLLTAGAQSSDSTVQFYVDSSGSGFLLNLTAIPEKRVPSSGNHGTLLTVEVRNSGETTPLFTKTVNTSSGGTFSGMIVTVTPGTYDITAKGYSHLRVKKSNQSLSDNVSIDFTSAGSSPLLSGDVNGTNGDNKVNGIDLTLIVGGLASYGVRYDLNRDTRVNGIDLTNAVSNLNQLGAD